MDGNMITTEITVRQGIRTVADNGDISWEGGVMEAKRMITSSKVGIHTDQLCGYELKKALHRISIDSELLKGDK